MNSVSIELSGVINQLLTINDDNTKQKRIVISDLEVNPKYPKILLSSFKAIILETTFPIKFTLNDPITVRGLYTFKPLLQTLPIMNCDNGFIRYNGKVYY